MDYYKDIADAIREVTKQKKTYAASELANAIRNISTLSTAFTIEDCYQLFAYNSRLTLVDDLLKLCRPKKCDSMFKNCSDLYRLDLTKLNGTDIKSTNAMFKHCINLYSLVLPTTVFNKVYDCSYMFYNCKKLISVDITCLNNGRELNTDYIFNGCDSLKEIIIRGANVFPINPNKFAINDNCSLYVQADMVEHYRNDPRYATIKERIKSMDELRYSDDS